MNKIRLQSEDFDTAAEIEALKKRCPGAGAIVTFTGRVRGDDGVMSMMLEHYPGMTEREIARHVEQAQSRWPMSAATILHRIGTLKPGDDIVLVIAAAPHRQAAFEAAQFLMDYLKTTAPFWKLERRGETSEWVEARASDEEAVRRWRED